MNRVAQAAPEVFQEQMEPLHRMIAAYGTEIKVEDENSSN
jgi:hypothetical protein